MPGRATRRLVERDHLSDIGVQAVARPQPDLTSSEIVTS
jgi:hypothetical protein